MDRQDTKLFSVIIPTYNDGRYLSRAIESVYDQPGYDYEIVVIDDGSTDNTALVVRAYQDRLNPPTYVYQQNRGLAASRNLGVRVSNGTFLLFLDADDALMPDALTAFRTAINQPMVMDFIIGGWVRVSTKGKKQEMRPRPLSENGQENFVSWLRCSPLKVLNGSNVVHRRVFERLIFPEKVRLWEDRVFYGQLFAGFRGMSIEDLVVMIYRHSDSLGHNASLVAQDAPKTVDLLFDPLVLPPQLMRYRAEYQAMTERVVFEALYSVGRYQEAAEAFHKAWRASPKNILTFRCLKRYLKIRMAVTAGIC